MGESETGATTTAETGGAVATEVCSSFDGAAVRLVDGGPCGWAEKHVCWAGEYAPPPATQVCSSAAGLDVLLVDPPAVCDAAHPKHVCDAS